MRCNRTRVLLAAVAGAAACNSPAHRSAPTAERVDSAGLEIVESPGEDRALDWRLDRVLTIPAESQATGAFDAVEAGVATDTAGNIYVLDFNDARILVFDSSGRFLRTQGRKGGGPGEAQFVIGLGVTPDGRSAIVDIGKRRLVWFSATGEVLPEEALGDGYFGGRLHFRGSTVVYEFQGVEDGRRVFGLRRSSDGAASTFVQQPTPPSKAVEFPSCGMSFTGMPPIFAPTTRWAAYGDRIAVVTDPAFDVRVFDGDREVRRIRRDLPARVATAELAARQLGEGMRVRTSGGERLCEVDEVVELRGFEPNVPLIGALALSPRGHLYVRRGGVKGEETPIDVFDGDAVYLGTLPSGAPFPAAFLPDGRMIVVERDELDVPSIVIYRATADVQ